MTPRPILSLALAGTLSLGGPAFVSGTQAPSDSLRGPGGAVPFLAQGPLLCGGASAAMVERFWGALDVHAVDYKDLVDVEAGGIFTDALVARLEERGHRAEVVRDAPEELLQRVADGLPVIALLESGRARYHYVVIVGVGSGEVVVHDPIRAPFQVHAQAEFLRRWEPSRFWGAVVFPVAPEALESAESPATEDALPPDLAEGVDHVRARRHEEAESAALRYLESVGEEGGPRAFRTTAWRVVAAARYMAGDGMGALAAWNRLGQPRTDLVAIHGLETMRHAPVADHLGLEVRRPLTPFQLQRARRRLAQLPAVAAGRVEYRPLPDGSVQVEAVLLERAPLPVTPTVILGIGVAGWINRRAALTVGPFTGIGERWSLEGSWEEARPMAGLSVALPWGSAGIASVDGGWMEERFAGPGPDLDESQTLARSWGTVALERWSAPGIRITGRAGVERWGGDVRMARLGIGALTLSAGGGLRAGGEVDGWVGAGEGHARLRLGAVLDRTWAGGVWHLMGGLSFVTGEAPPTLWDGAGTGRIRAPLLRGHRLVEGDRLSGPGWGRRLLHATVGHGWDLPVGPLPPRLTLFVDMAHVEEPLVGGAPATFLDPGVEVRLGLPGRALAVSLARGDAAWLLSARVDAGGLPWLSGPGVWASGG